MRALGVRGLVLAACALTLVFAAPARGAQTINVTSTADTVDASPANGFCELPCTLRAAVQTANGFGSPGADTIMVPAGTYNRTVGGADGADPAATGDLDVTENLTITGAGQSTTTVDAKSLERGFDIAPGVTATISGFTVTGGLASDGASMTTTGGGIRVGATPGGAATLTVNDVTLRANSARYGAGVATEAAGANLTLNRVSVLDNIAAAGGSEGGGVNEFRGGTVAINNSLVKGNASISGPGVTDDGGGNVAITDSTITENHAIGTTGHTGGVYETGGGTVTITRSTVSKNSAPEGGGVSEDGGGTVTIEDSTISENSATTGSATGGGVLRDAGGTVTIRGSTIAGNTAGSGGGIYNFGQTGTFEASNTTISANRAMTIGAQPAGTTGRGGGIRADRAGALKLTNVTLRNNLADAGATEIDNCTGPPSCSGAPQTVTLRNTIVAGAGTNCAGPISSGGHNLDSAHSCALTGTGDLVDKDPVLGPLADNGGPTFTHKVLDGSPAIDTGDPATCPAADQRGVLRPQGEACDIGAYEQGLGTRQCSDGLDNDGDGTTDFPADQGCTSAVDATEAPDLPQCSDRIDNDGDGRTNFPDDQGCESAADATESPDVPQCSDRIDNDGDGRANFPADLGCESATDTSESPDPPRTSILSDPDLPNWEGGYLDSVTVRVVATAAPGNAASETRCVLDPPSVPPSFDAMPPGCPYVDGAKITTAGTHTVFAASRAAGATEKVGSRVFQVIPYPVTKILSGPTGFTDSLPTFTFTGLPNGVTFRCRIDSGPFAPCTSPMSYYNLPAGPHTFTVRAQMANGTVDLNPPRRTFNQGVTTRVASCSGLIAFRPSLGFVCTVLKTACPAGSRCDVTTRFTGTENDPGVATEFAFYSRSPLYTPDGKKHESRADAIHSGLCYSKGPSLVSAALCPQTRTVSYYGPDPEMEIKCGAAGYLELTFGEKAPGPDDKRRVTCTSTLTIRPVPGLTADVSGTIVGASLPSAGTLVVGPRGAAGVASAAVRRKKKSKPKPFKTVTIKAKKAGPVRIPLKLTTAAKALLRRHRRLTLPISLTFKPTGGKKTTRRQRITLTLPPCKPPTRLPRSGRLPTCR